MERPQITPSLTLADFSSWYWLKAELVILCRTFGLSTTGTKLELEGRLRRCLLGTAEKEMGKRRKKTGEMPTTFTPETVIGVGWRCNPALGSYFRSVIGKGFRFNAAIRDFVHHNSGRTLADAVICFQASVLPDVPKPLIPRQLEYNQHFRDFFANNPDATRQEAIDAWWERRSKHNGTRSPSHESDLEHVT